MKNIHGFSRIVDYVKYKLSEYEKEEKTLETLFRYMFDETDNVMVETSDGYRVRKTTYGEFRARIVRIAPTLAEALEGVEMGSMVGLCCANCPDWIALLWATLMCGYRLLLMNTRLSHETLEGILSDYDVKAVISDGDIFSVKTLLKDDVAVETDAAFDTRPFGDEIIFMSSGTTDKVKLCAYTGENFYHQVRDSISIVESCPEIARHYEGELKQLTLLPFYHVFGFIAVYLWFGFFSRTFVFPKDLNPVTIQNTIKKHKVTHFFAVPMVWEAVSKAALNKIRSRGDKTYAKFEKASRMVNRGGLGAGMARRMLYEVREGLFGESIRFMITGGSQISTQTLAFFNGIGYHLANGYGMTELGITSLEQSKVRRIRNSGSIGAPFGCTEYRVSEDGVLLVKSKARAARILQGGTEQISDYDDWFSTNDLAECHDGHYYLHGRADDLIVCESGENLNPVLAEASIRVEGVEQSCIFADEAGNPVLLISAPGCFSSAKIKQMYEDIKVAVQAAKLDTVIRKVLFTQEMLMDAGDIKISRQKVARRCLTGTMRTFDPGRVDEQMEALLQGLESEVRDCFAEALAMEAEKISTTAHFFRDLGGNSIDYFGLIGLIKRRFGVEILYDENERLATVKDFCDRIERG